MNKRDKIGLAVAFLLGLLFNSIGTIVMVLRECWQSRRHGFSIEVGDVVRYSLVSSLGAVLNAVILVLLFK